MKKYIFTSIFLLASFNATARSGAYVGGHITASDFDVTNVKTEAINTTNGYAVTAGYGWQDSVYNFVVARLEVQYRNYGDIKFKIYDSGISTNVETDIHSYGVNFNPRFYMSKNFFGSFKVGYHRFEFDGKVDGQNYDEKSESQVIYGAGLGYTFDNISLDATYDVFQLESVDSGNFSLGLTYKF